MIVYSQGEGTDRLFGTGHIYYPMFLCDACGQEITNHGNVYWIVQDTGDILPETWHTHKDPCSQLDRTLNDRGLVMWEDLGDWIEQLTSNFHRQRVT